MAAAATPVTSTKASDLLSFLDWAREKNEIKANTVNGIKAACKAVLEAEGQLDAVEIRGIDLNAVFRRFQNSPAGRGLKPTSLRAYRQRVAQAIDMFLPWVDDRAGWKPLVSSREKAEPNGKPKPKVKPVRHDTHVPGGLPPAAEAKGLVDYPFPLKPGVMVHMYLPAEISPADVKRLNAYLSTLPADDAGGAS
jgi:hypothetical protein